MAHLLAPQWWATRVVNDPALNRGLDESLQLVALLYYEAIHGQSRAIVQKIMLVYRSIASVVKTGCERASRDYRIFPICILVSQSAMFL